MKRTIVLLLLMVIMLVPDSSPASKPSTNADVDKLQVQYLKAGFSNIRLNLSRLRNDLKMLSSSMTAHESTEAYLIKRSCDNIGSVEAICQYMERGMNSLLFVEADKVSYYCYLQKHGIEQMRKRSHEYLNNIKTMRTHVGTLAAAGLIAEAEGSILQSSGLIDKVLQMFQRHIGEEEKDTHH